MFPSPKRPSVLWVGLGGEVDALRQLWKDMEDCLSAEVIPAIRGGIRTSPWDGFVPRIIGVGTHSSGEMSPMDKLIARLQQTPSYVHIGSFTVPVISLMESRLSPAGPSYHPLSLHEFKRQS